jgi:hypothetical protein
LFSGFFTFNNFRNLGLQILQYLAGIDQISVYAVRVTLRNLRKRNEESKLFKPFINAGYKLITFENFTDDQETLFHEHPEINVLNAYKYSNHTIIFTYNL